MLLRRSIKAMLVLVVAAVVVAIVSSFLARSRNLPAPTETDLLPKDVESRGTNFDHSEFKLGRLVFRVRSQTDTVSAQGERQLQDVELLVIGPDGEVADAVTSREASYWVDQKKIQLRQQVELRLSDGTVIFSDRLEGDLAEESIHIPLGFRFTREEARGSGVDLTYRLGQRRLQAGRSFEMSLPVPEGQLRVTSQSADYDLAHGTLDLAGGAEIEGIRENLAAQRILLKLTPANHIRRLDGVGRAAFRSGPHHFAGGRILIDFDENGEGVKGFQVHSNSSSSAGEVVRAVYRQDSEGGLKTVLADRIELLPRPGTTSTSDIRLQSFLATGDVQFESPSHFLLRSRSDSLTGTFETSGLLSRVGLKGKVQLNRFPPGELSQSLEAPEVSYIFQEGRLSEMLAAGPVSLQLQGKAVDRTLVAGKTLRAWFEHGRPSRLEAQGEVRLKAIQGEEVSTLLTPRLTADFRDGLLHRLEAAQGVQLSSEDPRSTRSSTSRQFEASFEKGLLQEIIQRGDFLLTEETAEGKTELVAGEAGFKPASGTLQTSGETRGQLRQWESTGGDPVVTRADHFELTQRDQSVLAEGQVESEFSEPGGAETVQISSRRMQASGSTGWILYDTGEPLLVSRQSEVKGQSIRVQSATGIVVVEGSVDSLLTQPAEAGGGRYHVQSERLQIDRRKGNALYTGEVRAESEEMVLKAPFVELFLAPESNDRVEEVRAWEGVVIEEPNRVARGEKCFFFPGQNLVRLLGNPAEVTDQKQGRASGPSLLFYPGTEELIIESLTKKKP